VNVILVQQKYEQKDHIWYDFSEFNSWVFGSHTLFMWTRESSSN